MEARESVVVSGPSEVGGGGDGAKDSPSSTPSPSPTPSPPAGSGAVGMGAAVPPPPPPPAIMGMATGMSMGVGVGMEMGSCGSEDFARKKRGRPRKYGPDASSMSLALSPTSSSFPFSPVGVDFSGKRGRGRPPGSGKRQLLAALGQSSLSLSPPSSPFFFRPPFRVPTSLLPSHPSLACRRFLFPLLFELVAISIFYFFSYSVLINWAA